MPARENFANSNFVIAEGDDITDKMMPEPMYQDQGLSTIVTLACWLSVDMLTGDHA